MNDRTHRVIFEGGPFHGKVVTFNAPPPNHAKINRGEYEMVGRTEAGLFLLRWKGVERS